MYGIFKSVYTCIKNTVLFHPIKLQFMNIIFYKIKLILNRNLLSLKITIGFRAINLNPRVAYIASVNHYGPSRTEV